MDRAPVVHLMLDFNGLPAPALGTIWDYILADPGVLQHIREAAANNNDLVITAVTGPSGVLAKRPYISLRQSAPGELNHYDTYLFASAVPAGVAEVRVHLTGQPAAELAARLERYSPVARSFGLHKKTG